MTARGADWGLAALVVSLMATGVLTLFAGESGDAWVFAAHDALGIAVALLLITKLRRVWPRVAAPARWERRTIAGVLGIVVAAAALVSGWLWAGGVTPDLAGYSSLGWHEALGVVLAVAVAAHMLARAKPLRGRDLVLRRQFLTVAGIAVGSLVAWRTQRPLEALFHLRGAKRRFTGSYEAASFAGNGVPYNLVGRRQPTPDRSWLLSPARRWASGAQVRAAAHRVGGGRRADRHARLHWRVLFTQRWRGVRLGRILDQAGVETSARHVRVVPARAIAGASRLTTPASCCWRRMSAVSGSATSTARPSGSSSPERAAFNGSSGWSGSSCSRIPNMERPRQRCGAASRAPEGVRPRSARCRSSAQRPGPTRSRNNIATS